MNEQQPIEAEVVPQQAVAIRHEQQLQPGLFGATEPAVVITKATEVATALKAVIKKQGLISNISGKEYPKCEAWTLLGTMLGVFPVLVWTKPVEKGWEARVEARTKDGSIVGAAEAECLRTEKNWSNRDDFAIRSMAQTRATAKCLRMPLGFIMTLAGYEATPAEEMAFGEAATPRPPQQPTQPPKTPPAQSQVAKKATPMPTEESRKKMIAGLKAELSGPNREIVIEYFQKVGQLLPTELLEEIPLRFVPGTQKQMGALMECLTNFESGGEAIMAFEPHDESFDKACERAGQKPPEVIGNIVVGSVTVGKPKPIDVPRDIGQPAIGTEASGEPWHGVIVPVPHKGQKRDAYLQNPDTIGSLYDARHDDEDARKRLWGFVSHYEAKGWTKGNGQQMPPSKTDVKFRESLDQFSDWFEKNHPDEKL